MNLVEIELERVDWIHTAQDSDRWQAVVNVVKNLSSVKVGSSFSS